METAPPVAAPRPFLAALPAYVFFSGLVILVYSLVLKGQGGATMRDFYWAVALACSSLGFYHAPAPGGAGGAALSAAMLGALRRAGAAVLRLFHRGGGAAPLPLLVLLLLPGCNPAVVGSVVLLARVESGGEMAPAATSITPITALSAAGSGLAFSGESYDVTCTVSGKVTLYPAVYTSSWTVYQGYACTLDAAVATVGTCTFPAYPAPTAPLYNAYQTGSGSTSSCTAAGRQGPVPAQPPGAGGSGSGGTVTSISCSTGLTCTPSPITGTGSIAVSNTAVTAGTYGSATVVPQITVNAQGQITAETDVTISGVAPGGTASGDLSGSYPGPTVAKINGSTLGSTTPTAANLLLGSGTQWVTRAMSGDVTINSTGTATLASSGVTAGTYGDASHVAQVTFDAKGRATAASNVAISVSASGQMTLNFYAHSSVASGTHYFGDPFDGTLTTTANDTSNWFGVVPCAGKIIYITGGHPVSQAPGGGVTFTAMDCPQAGGATACHDVGGAAPAYAATSATVTVAAGNFTNSATASAAVALNDVIIMQITNTNTYSAANSRAQVVIQCN